jgi:Sel1 repeat
MAFTATRHSEEPVVNARIATSVAILFACCALPVPGRAQIEGVFIQSTPERDAPAYDTGYGAEVRLRGAGNTPEADGRPGEYYFIKGADAFRKHEYEFAIEMYRVAASWAYKPAEYNLGVMYARGQGVDTDLPRALAWMALAAERNEKHYVDAREAIYAAMTREQFDQANVIWRDLKQTYGDEVALVRAKRRWAEVKSQMTGSRVGSVGNLSVGVPNGRLPDPGSQKPGSEGMAKALAALGVKNTRTSGSTAAEALSGNGVDGSVAYRQLLESDNPYDPKFENLPAGTAIVGPPEAVDAKASGDGKAKDGGAAPNDRDERPSSGG